MKYLVVLLCLILTACTFGQVKPIPPAANIIEKPVKVYVPVKDELVAKCPWPKDIKPSQTVEANKKRRECLEKYELQLDGISKIRGKPVP